VMPLPTPPAITYSPPVVSPALAPEPAMINYPTPSAASETVIDTAQFASPVTTPPAITETRALMNNIDLGDRKNLIRDIHRLYDAAY
jgi:hypothetical protein